MEMKMGPNYACLFVGYVERKKLEDPGLKITRKTSPNALNVILMTYLGHPLAHEKTS